MTVLPSLQMITPQIKTKPARKPRRWILNSTCYWRRIVGFFFFCFLFCFVLFCFVLFFRLTIKTSELRPFGTCQVWQYPFMLYSSKDLACCLCNSRGTFKAWAETNSIKISWEFIRTMNSWAPP